ncbi:MAG TPA: hypothetical protein VFX97_06150 [Pyrinomonadaceae bacterium]|nr:hypothetical protein [Pyrinomonadaceae bacterium]
MRSPSPRLIVCAAHLILAAGLSQTFLSSSEAKHNAWQGGVNVTSKNLGGAIEVKIDTGRYGNVKVYLPDDMRAGDTISGTLVTEPKGNTPEEVAKNKSELESLRLGLGSETVTVTEAQFTVKTREIVDLPASRPNLLKLVVLAPEVSARPVTPQQTPNFIIDGANVDLPLYDPPKANAGSTIVFPLLTQQGRASVIHGAFDGDLVGTGLIRPGFGQDSGGPIRVLAESPRQLVFVAPEDITGPYSINIKEGDKAFTGNSRNIAVRLSAPKLDLLRGEKTTLTIEVSGLAGIIKDVPLQLDARGVINMDGGNFQNLRIKPEEVKLDGRYTTNRTITALQAGGFSVTATVIVRPFDICLQDEVDPSRMFQFNSFTGDYSFTNLGPADSSRTSGLKLQPGGGGGGAAQTGKLQSGGGGSGAAQTGAGSAPPTGSAAGAVTFTGIGKPAMKGCIITLSHNAPDRRVFAKLDVCTNSGDAQVETKATKTTSEITDKNTENNSCPSSPK